jgi:hypothetical protein
MRGTPGAPRGLRVVPQFERHPLTRFPGGQGAPDEPLVSTRISRREQRPRRLQPANCASFESARKPAPGRGSGPGSRPKPNDPPATLGAGARAVLPRHVRACQHSEYRTERWYVWTWKRHAPLVQTRVAYSCGSWRCSVCCRHEAAVTFARIQEATSRPEYDPRDWVFLVLTLDRDGYYSGKPWLDVNDAYRSLGGMMERLLKRLRRAYGERFGAWCAVVEAHRSGWPHVNVLLSSPKLAHDLTRERERRLAAGATERESELLGGELLEHAEACGWGRQSTASAARDKNAIAGYIVKLAGQHDSSVGEVAKITQAPTMAPAKFRRLRSAKGFLPPRRRDPNITGALVRRRRSPQGDWQILRLNPPHDPAQLEPTERAVAGEFDLIREEEELLARARGRGPPPMPPIRLAVCGRVETLQEATERRAQAAAGGGAFPRPA